MRHALIAETLVHTLAARLALPPGEMEQLFRGIPLDFPVIFRPTLPFGVHRQGMVGITLFKKVYLTEGMAAANPQSLLLLVLHEAVHVRQQRAQVLFYPCYGLAYLWGMLRFGFRRGGGTISQRMHKAYRQIPAERAAYATEGRARLRLRRILEASGQS